MRKPKGVGRPPADTTLGIQSVRQSISGADRAFRVIEGGGGNDELKAPTDDNGVPWPITPLGQLAGVFHFLDAHGQHRALTSRQLGARHDILSLFGGDDAWLRAQFPKKIAVKSADEHGAEGEVWRTVDFKINDASAALQRACFQAGLFGEHINLRQPGVWRDLDNMPVVHCGDQVYLRNAWHSAGKREGNQIWAAAPPTPRPSVPCSAATGQQLQRELTVLWRWREPGAPTAILGLICNAYYGAALDWRPAAFVTGETGSGKSALLTVVRAALPMHHYDNDTTKAGIEQALHGRAMAIVIDEAADRANRNVSRELADLVLSAASGEGTRGSRGTTDGKGRRIELAGLILMFSINPPDLEAQHLGRMLLIELQRPDDGSDHRAEHRALAQFARAHGAALWARALASWDRYQATLERMRDGLRAHGCAPREMDQAGALLAGYWILAEEGLPDERGVARAISALHGGSLNEPGLIRGAAEIEADSRPRRMLDHLLSIMIRLHRSTDREPVGKLIEIAFGDYRGEQNRSPDDARELLTHYGMRVVRAKEKQVKDRLGRERPVPRPRGVEGAGVWFSNGSPELRCLFEGTPYDGDRWRHEMLRLPSARRSDAPMTIGSVRATRAIWLSLSDIEIEDPDE